MAGVVVWMVDGRVSVCVGDEFMTPVLSLPASATSDWRSVFGCGHGRVSASRSYQGMTSAAGTGALARSLAFRVATGSVPAYEAGLVGEDDGLDPVAGLELHEDASDVGLDRRLGEEEPLSDLGVAQRSEERRVGRGGTSR